MKKKIENVYVFTTYGRNAHKWFFFLKNQQKLIIGTKVKFYLKYND